jgi:hypothetical protein
MDVVNRGCCRSWMLLIVNIGEEEESEGGITESKEAARL